MRALVLSLMLAALAACGDASAPVSEAEAQSEMPPQHVLGHFKAASETARGLTGDVSIERGGLIFSRGAVLYTRTLEPRRGGDQVAWEGASYAAIALGTSDLAVELRRVTEAQHAEAMCGLDTPTYVALVHEMRPVAVTMLVFAGDEPPGPEATRSRLCASFGFTAPQGARTREGVVLR